MMEKASDTYEGKLSIAKDNWKAMLAEMGKSLQDSLKSWLDDFNEYSDRVLGRRNIKTVIASGGSSGNIQAALAFARANPTQLEGVIPPVAAFVSNSISSRMVIGIPLPTCGLSLAVIALMSSGIILLRPVTSESL